MQPGLRRLAADAPHLTAVSPGSRHQREKLAVLSRFASQALLASPHFDPSLAMDALARQAQAEHPEVIQWDGRRLVSPSMGVAVNGSKVEDTHSGSFGLGDEIGRCLRQLPSAWRSVGLLSLAFAEDFAVVSAADACVPWMAVSLPSFWAPEEKVGRPFTAIHAPVADSQLLQSAGSALMQLVSDGQAWERFVWTITPHSRLHAHPHRVDPRGWQGPLPVGTDIAQRAWWRTERQTFLPVSQRELSVFTIRVEMTPLAKALQSPLQARRLHEALSSMTPAVLDYRGLTPVRDALLTWLDHQAQILKAPQA